MTLFSITDQILPGHYASYGEAASRAFLKLFLYVGELWHGLLEVLP